MQRIGKTIKLVAVGATILVAAMSFGQGQGRGQGRMGRGFGNNNASLTTLYYTITFIKSVRKIPVQKPRILG